MSSPCLLYLGQASLWQDLSIFKNLNLELGSVANWTVEGNTRRPHRQTTLTSPAQGHVSRDGTYVSPGNVAPSQSPLPSMGKSSGCQQGTSRSGGKMPMSDSFVSISSASKPFRISLELPQASGLSFKPNGPQAVMRRRGREENHWDVSALDFLASKCGWWRRGLVSGDVGLSFLVLNQRGRRLPEQPGGTNNNQGTHHLIYPLKF